MKKLKRVSVRDFSRNFYKYIDKTPIGVYNNREKKYVVVVISVEEGGEKYDLRTKDSVQSKK